MGHRAVDCRLSKKKKNKEANVIEEIMQEIDDLEISVVVSKVNLIGSNPREWWIDTGVTHYVCSDKSMFTTFEPVEIGEKLFMRNFATSEIQGEGKVILKMTSKKILTLNTVLYVP